MGFLDFMSPIDYILPGLIAAGVVFAFTFGKDIGKNCRGLWRLLITIPLVGMCAVPLNISIGTAIDPSSHNLAPIELIVWCGGFLLWFLAIWFLWRITRPQPETRRNRKRRDRELRSIAAPTLPGPERMLLSAGSRWSSPAGLAGPLTSRLGTWNEGVYNRAAQPGFGQTIRAAFHRETAMYRLIYKSRANQRIDWEFVKELIGDSERSNERG